MLTATAYGLAVVLNLFVVFIGLNFLRTPEAAATGYGIPAKKDGEAGPYLTIKGIREGTYGIMGLALLAFASAEAGAWFMLVVALNPLFDTVHVLRNGGSKATAYGIHFATAVVVLISAALLFSV